MRFYNILRYDVRLGLMSKPAKWAVTLFFFAFLFLSFTFDIFHMFFLSVERIGNINILSLSVGDVILFELGGKLPLMSINHDTVITFPTAWFLAHVLACYFTLHYMSEDLSHGGLQVITRTKNKACWWLSKCVWNVITVILYYVIAYGVLYVLCLLTEKNNTLELNSNLFTVLFSARLADNNPTDMTLFLYLCALPCLVGITINLCQMTLTLFLKPVFAFFASCVYIIAGMYYANPLFISNYAIPVRGKVMGVYNFSFSSGAIICIIFCCTAIFVGAIRINKMDLMNY